MYEETFDGNVVAYSDARFEKLVERVAALAGGRDADAPAGQLTVGSINELMWSVDGGPNTDYTLHTYNPDEVHGEMQFDLLVQRATKTAWVALSSSSGLARAWVFATDQDAMRFLSILCPDQDGGERTCTVHEVYKRTAWNYTQSLEKGWVGTTAAMVSEALDAVPTTDRPKLISDVVLRAIEDHCSARTITAVLHASITLV